MWTWRSPLDQRSCSSGGSDSSGESAIGTAPVPSPPSPRPLPRPNLEPLRHLDRYRSLRDGDFGLTRGMKVVFLEPPLGADEGVVGVDPGVLGSVRAGVGAFARDPGPRGN